MADLVMGAALGTAFTVLYDAVDKATVGNFKKIKPLLGALKSTLASVQPLVIKQIGDYNVKLELPNDEIEELKKQMREGKALIRRLSKLRWWNSIKSSYIVQLVELDASLKGLLKHIEMQQSRDIKENLLVAKQTAKQLAEFQEHMLLQEGLRDSERLQNNGKQLLQLERVIEKLMLQLEAKDVTDGETGDLVGVTGLVTLYKVLSGSVQHISGDDLPFSPVLQRILRKIKATLLRLEQVIILIEPTDEQLSYGQMRQIERLKTQMRDGVELFRKYSKIGTWNIYKSLSYTVKLIQWEESLQIEIDILFPSCDLAAKFGWDRRSC